MGDAVSHRAPGAGFDRLHRQRHCARASVQGGEIAAGEVGRRARGQAVHGQYGRAAGGLIRSDGYGRKGDIADIADGAVIGERRSRGHRRRGAVRHNANLGGGLHRAHRRHRGRYQATRTLVRAGHLERVGDGTAVEARRHRIAGGKIGRPARRQAGRGKDHRVVEAVRYDRKVEQGNVARVTDGRRIGQRASQRRRRGGAALRERDGGRRRQAADGGDRGGDRPVLTDILGAGGQVVGDTARVQGRRETAVKDATAPGSRVSRVKITVPE